MGLIFWLKERIKWCALRRGSVFAYDGDAFECDRWGRVVPKPLNRVIAEAGRNSVYRWAYPLRRG